MSESITAEYDGHAIIPDQPLALVPGQRLRVTFEPADDPNGSERRPLLPPELETRADGAIVIHGHRIALHLILEDLHKGTDFDEMLKRYPDVDSVVLRRVIDFCREHSAWSQKHFEEEQALSRQFCDIEHRGPSLEELRSRR